MYIDIKNINNHFFEATRTAAKTGNLKEVKTLLAIGADIHAFNDIALRWACLKNESNFCYYNYELEVIKLLLEYYNLQNHEHLLLLKELLRYVFKSRQYEIQMLLLDKFCEQDNKN